MANQLQTKSGIIHIDGFDLRYCIEGTGIPAIVIGSAIYYPRTFSENLRQHFQLIFIDHRGFSSSKNSPAISEIELDVILNDIDIMRTKLGLEKIVIIGHSGHGFMALEYAKKYSQFVSHVVLIAMGPNTSIVSQTAADQYFNDVVCPERKAILEENLKQLPKEIEEFPEKRFITFCLRLGARSWYDYLFDASPLWKGVEVNMPIIDYLWGIVFRDIDITADLEDFDVPIFLALGQHDFLVAPFFTWNSIREKFKNLSVYIFEKSSHTPQLEEHKQFDKEVLEWYTKNHENYSS